MNIEPKTKAAALGLSEHAMALYLGIPIGTYRKWANGTRALDAAPRRLLEVLGMVEEFAPLLHASLIDAAKGLERAETLEKQSRVLKGRGGAKKRPGDPPAPFVQVAQALPEWMTTPV